MKSFALLLATGVSAIAFASAVQAADLVVEGPGPIQYTEPSHSWDGPFVGVFGGYGWGTLDTNILNSDFAEDGEPSGWLLGVSAGANFTLTNGVVAGVVGDIAWADMNDDFSGQLFLATSTVDWAGSIRGRVGFDGGAFMPYLTAGLAFAHNTVDLNSVGPIGTDDQTHIGWTVGAGVEFAVAENISLDLLYRYSDYGTATYEIDGYSAEAGLTAHQISAGINFGF